jgi:hypothetical protein
LFIENNLNISSAEPKASPNYINLNDPTATVSEWEKELLHVRDSTTMELYQMQIKY